MYFNQFSTNRFAFFLHISIEAAKFSSRCPKFYCIIFTHCIWNMLLKITSSGGTATVCPPVCVHVLDFGSKLYVCVQQVPSTMSSSIIAPSPVFSAVLHLPAVIVCSKPFNTLVVKCTALVSATITSTYYNTDILLYTLLSQSDLFTPHHLKWYNTMFW